MIDGISVDFMEWQNGGEIEVGRGIMPHAPRVGELIWFRPGKKPSYRVTEVAYWVGDLLAEGVRTGSCSCAAYVEEVKD
jgi:hypothetical protein